jgi:histidinol dehydrogenase
MKIVQCGTRSAEAAIARIERARERSGRTAEAVARRVIDRVRRKGDEGVSRILQEIDGVSIAPAEILTAPQSRVIDGAMEKAIELAIERIETFHLQQLPHGYRSNSPTGSRSTPGKTSEMTHRVRPLGRVGIYAPGGRAVYLSTLIMCAVPARIAGVHELVVATTPAAAARGEFELCCQRLGIGEIYRAGGPAGIAAMAFGTNTLRRVDKIVGPGNAYVTAAKKLLVDRVGVDMIAGPTELVLIADEAANPEWVAADLLAQAEHGVDSSIVCIAFERRGARDLADEVERQLTRFEQEEGSSNSVARQCLVRSGVILIARSAGEAVELANRLAPEHLSLHWKEANRWVLQIENCGAVFIGGASPVAAGDYIAGPNHVLPTGGTARYASPLGVYDFVKRSNVIRLSGGESRALAAAETIARFEGLPLHARSLALRRDADKAASALALAGEGR